MRLVDIHNIHDTIRYRKGLMFHPKNVQERITGRDYIGPELVDFLLTTSSLALYTLIAPKDNPFPGFASLVLHAANLSHGHSEGKNTVLVQNSVNRVGPWTLIKPSENRDFYLQNVTLPYATEAKFQPELDTLSKIRKRYICFPHDPEEIFDAFKQQNYQFFDTRMPEELYRKLTK